MHLFTVFSFIHSESLLKLLRYKTSKFPWPVSFFHQICPFGSLSLSLPLCPPFRLDEPFSGKYDEHEAINLAQLLQRHFGHGRPSKEGEEGGEEEVCCCSADAIYEKAIRRTN